MGVMEERRKEKVKKKSEREQAKAMEIKNDLEGEIR